MAIARIVLVVADNDVDFLESLTEKLNRAGVDVIPVVTEADARLALLRSDINLALIDVRLTDDDDPKDTTGLELAADEAFRGVPKVVMSAYPTTELMRRVMALREGRLPVALDFVAKDSDLILVAILKALAVVRSSQLPGPRVLRIQPPQKVFLVHGHDKEALYSLAFFITKLGLEPVILSEMATDGNMIMEALEKHGQVDFVVALLTPDDTGSSKKTPEIVYCRARQNVIFELGYFLGRLGRKNVRALRKGEVEILSDFHGVIYIPFDDSDGWKFKLAKDLKAAGLVIDLDGVV